MSYTKPTPRTYTYRIDLDDRKAFRKINVLDALDAEYWITKLHRSQVPTVGNGRHFGFVFYQSKEHFDHDRNEMVGGTIPGLSKYRYSLEWEPCPLGPMGSALEMRNANGGGTRIKGRSPVGTSDPRIPNDIPVDFTVPYTPTEIKKIAEGEPVDNKSDYRYSEYLAQGSYVTRHPDVLENGRGESAFNDLLQMAETDGFEKAREAVHEYESECDHAHTVTTGRENNDVAYCEDCGRGWDRPEFEHDSENDDLTVVGSVA
jgi:hypothetical protein